MKLHPGRQAITDMMRRVVAIFLVRIYPMTALFIIMAITWRQGRRERQTILNNPSLFHTKEFLAFCLFVSIIVHGC